MIHLLYSDREVSAAPKHHRRTGSNQRLLRGSGSAADLDEDSFSILDAAAHSSGFPMAPVQEQQQFVDPQGGVKGSPVRDVAFLSPSARPAMIVQPTSVASASVAVEVRKTRERSPGRTGADSARASDERFGRYSPLIGFTTLLLVVGFMLLLSKGGFWSLLVFLRAPSPDNDMTMPPPSPPPPPVIGASRVTLWAAPKPVRLEEEPADFGRWDRRQLGES